MRGSDDLSKRPEEGASPWFTALPPMPVLRKQFIHIRQAGTRPWQAQPRSHWHRACDASPSPVKERLPSVYSGSQSNGQRGTDQARRTAPGSPAGWHTRPEARASTIRPHRRGRRPRRCVARRTTVRTPLVRPPRTGRSRDPGPTKPRFTEGSSVGGVGLIDVERPAAGRGQFRASHPGRPFRP